MEKNHLIAALTNTRGAKIYLRPDHNSNAESKLFFAYIECDIINLRSFEETAPDFLLVMIENSHIKRAITSYNSWGKGFYIGRSIEVDSEIQEQKFDGIQKN